MVDQLPLKIPFDNDLNLDNFQPRPSLLQLLTEVEALLEGAGQSLFLWGPSGSGKSHLLQGVSRAIGARALYLPMTELLEYPPEAVLEGVIDCEAVLIDDVQLIFGRDDWQETLFHSFNQLKAGIGRHCGCWTSQPARFQVPFCLFSTLNQNQRPPGHEI